MQISAKAKNIISFVAGIAIAAAFFVAPLGAAKDRKNGEMAITGVTNASEVIRESRFEFFDLNGDGYLTREEIPENERILMSMYTSLDENGDGKLSEPEYVLNGKAE